MAYRRSLWVLPKTLLNIVACRDLYSAIFHWAIPRVSPMTQRPKADTLALALQLLEHAPAPNYGAVPPAMER